MKQCCLRKTKSQVLEDFSTVGKVKSRVQEVILDRKYQLGIIRKLDSHSQIVFYFLKSKSLKSSTKAFCEGFFDHFEQNSHHFWPTRSCSSTSRHELRARSSFSARANNYGGLKINTNCFNGTHSTRSWSSTFRHEFRTRSNLSARVKSNKVLKINTKCFNGTHSTRSDSSEAAAACQGSACFVQELSLISVMIFVDATCSPGNDKNVALVV